jgi:macrolide transport system ATP-binding/permease protein
MALRALVATEIVRTLGLRRVLDGVTLSASPGERIGLIGENGVGKSTLLRLLAGVDEPEAGRIERPPDLGFLPQEPAYDPGIVLQHVIDEALRESHDAIRRLDELSEAVAANPDDVEGLAAYGEALESAQDHDAWDADRRADLVLHGLGLAAVPRHRALREISGGERRRLTLATLLIRRPGALLLDEPTNHLDNGAAEFLERQLRDTSGVVIVASHDRAFLDAVCTDVIDLDPAISGPVRYGGDYSAYQQSRRAERHRWERQFAAEQAELTELRSAVSVTAREVADGRPPRDSEKMGYGHTAGRVQQQISRRVRDAARRLAELERTQVRKPPPALQFRAPALALPSSGSVAVSLRNVEVAGRLQVGRVDIGAGDHLLVTGPNGAGKSTLLGVIAGTIPATGSVLRRPGIRIGYLPQDTIFERSERTAHETWKAALGAERAERMSLRSLGLVSSRDAAKPVGVLSVGQRRRLALALVLADPPDLLLLDEPTNHLSPLLADELQDAFDSAPSTFVVASHDRWLRRRWVGPQLELVDGACRQGQAHAADLSLSGHTV